MDFDACQEPLSLNFLYLDEEEHVLWMVWVCTVLYLWKATN